MRFCLPGLFLLLCRERSGGETFDALIEAFTEGFFCYA
jgi:hypothetical protein